MGLGGLGHMGVQIAAAMGAEVTVLSRSLKKADAAKELGAVRTLATSDENFFEEHRGEFDLILNTISAPIDLGSYLNLLKPRGIMSVVGLTTEPLPLQIIDLIRGGRVLTGNNIGGIPETQEMLDFCAEHGIASVIEKVNVHEVDDAYDRVVAGDVKFRIVIDTETFDPAE